MKRPNKEYGIRAMVCDWALDISMGDATFVLYFNSRNNAELVKAVLEWEDTHPNEAAPYQLAIPNLHPISREQAEKVWRSEWKENKNTVIENVTCSKCKTVFQAYYGNYQFCPRCGKAMTDKAVQMVMERLEELSNGKG